MGKFKHLDVPRQWTETFTKYPHGLTIFEALVDWTSQVDKMVDNINDWNDYLDGFVDNFEFELQEEVKATITKWQNEGLLDDIIESALNTELDNVKTQLVDTIQNLNDIAINIKQFPRLEGESEDCPRFKRAIEYLSDLGGGTLQLDVSEYIFNTGFTIPDNIVIKGQGNKSGWASDNVTLLKYFGEGDFITLSSYYDKKSKISNLNITCGDGLGRKSQTTGIRVAYDNGSWGGSAIIEQVTISHFGVGIQHTRAWQSIVTNSVIWECGTGVSYNAYVEGKNPSFGNGNTVEHTTIYDCDIGVELASDTLNVFKQIDIEKCYIAILVYKLAGGYYPPMQNRFENCWFEANGWRTTDDKINNINPRYVVCNSEIDNDFLATNSNTVSLESLSFVNCRFDGNVWPQVPSFNSNYDIYHVSLPDNIKRYPTDESIRSFYQRDNYAIDTVAVGIEHWKRIYSLSNKGLNVKLGFNLYEKTESFETTGTTTQKVTVDYSKIINPVPEYLFIANQFSSIALMNIGVKHSNGYFNNRIFIISDFATYEGLMVQPLSESTNNGTMLSGNKIEVVNIQGIGTESKTFDVQVTGNLIQDVNIKINFLPSGLLI